MNRKLILIISSIIVLIILNFAIFEKEQLISNGETVFLALAPVDPRSLMQGDYMALRYEIESKVTLTKDHPAVRNYMVIELDQNKVGSFSHFYQGEEVLYDNQKLLRYREENLSIKVFPKAFFFQEGHAQLYQNAKYGEFKFDKSGNHLLIGLADKDLKSIKPQ
jgi:uncharacterized membrane-anchored protein